MLFCFVCSSRLFVAQDYVYSNIIKYKESMTFFFQEIVAVEVPTQSRIANVLVTPNAVPICFHGPFIIGYLPIPEKENQSNNHPPLQEARGEGSPWVRVELRLQKALRAEKVSRQIVF